MDPLAPRDAARPRPGGRSARVVEAVLRATLAELARVGRSALRIDEVAARARVNKTSIYRRWPTVEALVGAAVRTVTRPAAPLPDTGSLRGDLAALIRELRTRTDSVEARAIASFVASERTNPEVAALATALREEGIGRFERVLRRGMARRELPTDTDARSLAETLTAPLHARLVHRGRGLDERFATTVLSIVLDGALHGGAVPMNNPKRRRRRRASPDG